MSTVNGTVSFGGLMSGLDTTKIIAQLVQAESVTVVKMQGQQVTLANKQSELETIKGKVKSLKSAAFNLTQSSDLTSYKTTSSDSSVIEATLATSVGVQKGAIAIDTIASMATFQRQVFSNAVTPIDDPAKSLGYADATTLTITSYTSGVSDVSVTVDSNTTMNSLADLINNATGNDLATASIINTSADPNSPDYKLIVKAKNTGLSDYGGAQTRGFDANQVLTLATAFDTNDNQNSTDAVLDIDGVTVSRSTNTFTNILNGLTFTLKDVPAVGSSITVSVADDVNAVGAKVAALVTSYNDFVNEMNAQFTLNPETNRLGILGGDSSLKLIQKAIVSMITGHADGLRPGYNNVAGLADLGWSSDQKTGLVTFDQSIFTDKFQTYQAETKAVFLASSKVNGVATKGIASKLYDYAAGLVDTFNDPVAAKTYASVLDSKIASLESNKKLLDQRIAAELSRISSVEERYNKQFNAMEQLINGLQAQGNMLESFFATYRKK